MLAFINLRCRSTRLSSKQKQFCCPEAEPIICAGSRQHLYLKAAPGKNTMDAVKTETIIQLPFWTGVRFVILGCDLRCSCHYCCKGQVPSRTESSFYWLPSFCTERRGLASLALGGAHPSVLFTACYTFGFSPQQEWGLWGRPLASKRFTYCSSGLRSSFHLPQIHRILMVWAETNLKDHLSNSSAMGRDIFH